MVEAAHEAGTKKIAIIFDAYNTLITVDKEGRFAPHFDALEALKTLKKNKSVSLLAQDFKDSHDAFVKAHPLAADKSLFDLLSSLYGEQFKDSLFHWVG